MPTRNDPPLAALGEWGFLRRLLPRLQRRSARAFLVAPGDDAAVLAGGERPVLSIDGLTDGTHFHSSWERRVRSLTGVSLGRALAWKLIGSCVSDLAAMGATFRRWAMVYLGAPGSVKLSFLNDLYAGLDEAARRQGVALAGGDTVRASRITLVAAVGGGLKGRPLTRRGARPGMDLCVAGFVGDAAAGLRVLQGRKNGVEAADARYFARRFFDVRPQLEMGERLARERGVGGAIDVSDALSDCLSILCRDSGVGADIDIGSLPTSAAFRRHFRPDLALSGGEDYALLFAATPAAARRLSRAGAVVIGRVTQKRSGIQYRQNGRPIPAPRSFQHFG
jgi:thiamine-monophosphate kinase